MKVTETECSVFRSIVKGIGVDQLVLGLTDLYAIVLDRIDYRLGGPPTHEGRLISDGAQSRPKRGRTSLAPSEIKREPANRERGSNPARLSSWRPARLIQLIQGDGRLTPVDPPELHRMGPVLKKPGLLRLQARRTKQSPDQRPRHDKPSCP